MKTFHGKAELKEMLLEETKKHRAADEIIQGSYEREGKFCAVGCSIESLNKKLGKNYSHSDHSVYETELGIPRIIARLEDKIFEGLPTEIAKDFPVRFVEAVPVDVDLSLVWPKYAVWILVDPVDGVIRYAKTDEQKSRIQKVADLYTRVINGETIESLKKDFRAAAAYAAYAADAAAAAYAADAAYAAAADAAYAAYAAAAYAAAAYAADAAAAAYAADAYAARKLARSEFFIKSANKLLEIISATL